METKLLTEAQWCRLLAPYGATEILPYLGEHGLIAEPVDPLAEAIAKVPDEDIRRIADSKDVAMCRWRITDALRPFCKELAEPKPLTLDMVREAHRASIDMDGDSFHDRFHAAIVKQMKGETNAAKP
jgi:hypothetical protein